MRTVLLLCLALAAGGAWAQKGRYLTLPQFLDRAFAGQSHQADTLWIQDDWRPEMERILDHRFSRLRVRYWRAERRSAWIFDEIGKEQPITIGVVVDGGRIDSVQILEFRESRGGEVRYPFFTDQFRGLSLVAAEKNRKLSDNIDGITGATLSVSAVTRVATLALYLHEKAFPSASETPPTAN
ncbi:FMN-binding protein [Gallaecimonas sp. GXIMD4217]|uniref:FMN-binding protein n=1 Tax=Gallaecimonas sp. GXIMD4217 TaxID=3131927 RepID=UPI00311AF4F2